MRLPVVACLAGLALLLGAFAWLHQSQFLPVVGRASVSYYLGAAPVSVLVTSIALAGLLLVGFHVAVNRLLGRPTSPATPGGVYLTPLALVGVSLSSLGVLKDSLRDIWAPIAYLAIDLRWPIALIAVGLCVRGLAGAIKLPRLGDDSKRLAADLLLAGGAVAFVVITSPQIRFTAFATGDEPKYIRYLENWWQGNGMQIDTFKNVHDLPAGSESHLLRNLTYIWPAIGENAASLAADISSLTERDNWTRRWNRAEAADNHIVRGKNGWHYQIHPPGVSVLLLPAYLIDRSLFDRGTSAFADDLFASQLVMLIVFAALVLAAFRMAAAASGDARAAGIAVIALMLSLPIAAFPFRFYPETTAGLLVCLVTWLLFVPRPLTHRLAIAVGLALVYMGWLHVRFLVVSGVALGWLFWRYRATPRPLITLAAAFGLGVTTLCAYAYHVTGSFLPSAPFALGVGSGYVNDRVPVGLVAMFVDRVYGLLPLAPIYLVAIPGLGLMAARRPRELAMITTLGLALIIPAAGQGYWTDGSVPWRHALAILPLAAIPLALWLTSHGRRRSTVAVTLLAAAMSIRSAVGYNLQNDMTITTMLDAGFSGWDLSLLFPVVHRVRVNPISVDAWLLIAVLVVIVAAFAYGALKTPADVQPRSSVSYAAAFAFALAVTAVVACTSIALGTEAHRWELLRGYRPPPPDRLPSYWFEIGQRPKAPWE